MGTAAAAVVLTRRGGTCETASIALTNLGETPLYAAEAAAALVGTPVEKAAVDKAVALAEGITAPASDGRGPADRSEEHTSELQSLMRISYAVFCLKKKKKRLHK